MEGDPGGHFFTKFLYQVVGFLLFYYPGLGVSEQRRRLLVGARCEGVEGLIMLKVKIYLILTFTSYGSDRDTCGGTCRGTGRRRLTRPRIRTPIRIAPMITTPIAAPGMTSASNMHRRGIAIISNGSNLGSCDMITNDFNMGTGTRKLGS